MTKIPTGNTWQVFIALEDTRRDLSYKVEFLRKYGFLGGSVTDAELITWSVYSSLVVTVFVELVQALLFVGNNELRRFVNRARCNFVCVCWQGNSSVWATKRVSGVTKRKSDSFRRDSNRHLNAIPGSLNSDMQTETAKRRRQPDRSESGERRAEPRDIEERPAGSRARSSGEDKARWVQANFKT